MRNAVIAVMATAVVLIAIGLVARASSSGERHVLIDTTQQVKVELDGKALFELAPGQHRVVTIDANAHDLKLVGPIPATHAIAARDDGACFLVRTGEMLPVVIVGAAFGAATAPEPEVLEPIPMIELTAAGLPCSLDEPFPVVSTVDEVVLRLCHLKDDGSFACP